MASDRIDDNHMGEIWPAAHPAPDPDHYGTVELTPGGAFAVRSLQTFRLVYTAGPYGIDDTGALRVLFRFPTDWGLLQTTDPAGENHVSAVASNGVALGIDYIEDALPRPRYHGLTVTLLNGYLGAGETLTITFGDPVGGSPGLRLQSFCESHFEFKVAVDVYATGQFTPIRHSPTIRIEPAAPTHWKAVAPTRRRPGEAFSLGIKAEDAWGNPAHPDPGTLHLAANVAVDGLPREINVPPGDRALKIEGLRVNREGIVRIRLLDGSGDVLAHANPVAIKTGPLAGYWGDLHGQSGESVGVGSIGEYFQFARDLAFLDACAHQANDFQINNDFWRHINQTTAAFNDEGHFVTFPGYEWSGNTGVGGDHNVYFRHEGRCIHRSSHALLPDRSDIDTDAPTAGDLFAALAGEDCIVYAHCGGRYADVGAGHDPGLETSMEIHSAWGTFEWLLADCFARGFRCGVVCNSDDHKGRPGASHPGTAGFATYGGLTCFLAGSLTRDALFDCSRHRHTYGTTGCRMDLDVRAVFQTAGQHHDRDPRAFEAVSRNVAEVMMGDIAQTDDDTIVIEVRAVSQAPIERIDILNGTRVVDTIRGYTEADLGRRIRVVWSGAEYRGRGNRTRWRGRARFTDCQIRSMTEINNWNSERRFQVSGGHTIVFESQTAGNFSGFDVNIDGIASGSMHIETDLVSGVIDLGKLGMDEVVMNAGGLDRQVRISRLPATTAWPSTPGFRYRWHPKATTRCGSGSPPRTDTMPGAVPCTYTVPKTQRIKRWKIQYRPGKQRSR
jgi:Protein of unknown function (DUF3604)